MAQKLHDFIAGLPAVDCHEHTFLAPDRPQPVTLGVLLRNSDVGDDLISAGMPVESRPVLDWQRAAPYLPAVRNTGFYRSLILAFQALFDFRGDELTRESWEILSGRIEAANRRPDWYRELLHETARIPLILRVQGDEPDPYDVDRDFFAPLIRIDDWILQVAPAQRQRLAADVGVDARTLGEFLRALDLAFATAIDRGAVGVKSMLAYHRTLAHDNPTAETAGRLFGRQELSVQETRLLQDFMAHEVLARAGAFNLPCQIHVGYGSWQNNIAEQANPLLLKSLIEAHRHTKFVLLHGGYPFVGEMATLAKNYPNVYLECGWLAYIAPVVYRRAVGEWLDAVPANKLLAFSADCLHIEQTYGTLLLTRQLLAQTLAEKMATASWDMALAESVAERLLYRNAKEVYRLELKH